MFSILLILSSFAFSAENTPQSFSLDGKLFQTGTEQPLLDSGSLVIQILDPAQNCILYEEAQTFDTTNTNGYFNIHIGSDTSATKRGTADSGNTLVRAFSNTNVTAIDGKLVSDGTTNCTYTAASGDVRRIRIKVIPSDNITRTLSPDMYVDSVPNAIVAESAETLQGLTPNDVLRIGTQQLTQANVQIVFSNSNYPTLTSLLAGNSTDYVQVDAKGAALPGLATDPTGAAEGQIWYDTTANVIKYKNNSGIQTVGVGGGSVTSVTAGTGLSGGTITGTGTISMPNVGTSGTYTKVTTDAQGRVSSGATLSESDIPTLSTAGKVSGDAINTGTIGGNTNISTTGTIGTSSSVSARVFDAYDSDNSNYVRIQTPVTGSLIANYTLTLPIDAGLSGQYLSTDGVGNLSWSQPPHCNSNEKLEISAGPIYLWSCVSESTGAILADADSNTKIQVEKNANEDKIRFDTGGAERMIIDNSGNVGIGTTNPAFSIDILGNDTSVISRITNSTSTTARYPQFRIVNYSGGHSGAGEFISLTARGNSVSPVAVSASDTLSFFVGEGYDGTGFSTGAANIQFVAAEGFTSSAHGTNMSFNTSNLGATSASEKMRISANGRVGIGTTVPGTLLDVVGAITSQPLGTDPGETGQIIFRELAANGTNTATLRAPDSIAANYNLTLPIDAGTANQVLTTDGSGVLTWASPSSASSVSAGAGTVGAPSVSFSGDSDTGFYSSGANTIGVSAGGANIFEVSNQGLVSTTAGGGVVTTGNGTVATPTFSFSGDTDTGWWSPAANTMAASTGGVERMRIESAGYVGIGTTNPSNVLTLLGSPYTNGDNESILDLYSNTVSGINSGAGISFGGKYTAGGSYGVFAGIRGVKENATSANSAGNLVFMTKLTGVTLTEQMRITSTGNLAIGTTTANDKLVVNGTFRNLAAVDRTSASTIDFSSGNIQYTTDNCAAFALHNVRSGGSYTFVVQGTVSSLCSFTAFSDAGSTALTVHMPADHGPSTVGKHTIYTAIVAGTHIYFAWTPDM